MLYRRASAAGAGAGAAGDIDEMPLFLSMLSFDVHISLAGCAQFISQFISLWLDMRSLAALDVAVSYNASRPYWITLLHSLLWPYPVRTVRLRSYSSYIWYEIR